MASSSSVDDAESPLEAGAGVFISRDGTQDAYEEGSPWYYITNVVMVLYALAYVGYLIAVANTTVPHTWFFGNFAGSFLYSQRYSSPQAVSLVFSGMRIFGFISMCALLTFRKTRCGRYAGCTIFWVVLLMILTCLEAISLAINMNFWFYANSHVVGNQDNPANHYLWCCDPDVYSLASNGCRPTSPCLLTPIPPGGLPLDDVFQWVLGLGIAFFTFDLYFVLLPVALWLHSGSPQKYGGSGGGGGDIDFEETKLMIVDTTLIVDPKAAVPIQFRKRIVK